MLSHDIAFRKVKFAKSMQVEKLEAKIKDYEEALEEIEDGRCLDTCSRLLVSSYACDCHCEVAGKVLEKHSSR